MPGKSGGSPHPALLPILLMMSQNGRDLEKSLDELVNFVQSAKNALEAMRNGMETFQAGMMKIVPPGPPGSPSFLSGWPSPPPKQKDTVSTTPVKDSSPAPVNEAAEAAVKSPHTATEQD